MVLRQQVARVRNRLFGPPRRVVHLPTPTDIDAHFPPYAEDPLDVQELLARYTVEELSEAADDYYRTNLDGAEYYLSKPASSIDEAPDLLICFGQVLAGVRPLRGMRVLDFGAGTGWTSRFLTQLGCEVVVCDVSPTALDIARRLFAEQPVAGTQPPPTFLRFDGHHLDLADESIDRVICIDAFHHVPNPAAVLHELGRVLRPGGIAGFQEPGPNQSLKPQSQYEMKNFTVIENDIRMRDIATWAEAGGFTKVELALFTAEPFHTTIAGYEDYLAHGNMVDHHYEHQRRFVADRRIFFLSKAGDALPDSRERSGLTADLTLTPDELEAPAGSMVRVQLTARNTGANLWLPSDAPVGPVLVGAHLYGPERRLLDLDYARTPLPPAGVAGTPPGERVTLDVAVPVPTVPGEYTIVFDLVADGVCWFEMNESRPATLRLTAV